MSDKDRFDFSPESRYGANPEQEERDFLASILDDDEDFIPRKPKKHKRKAESFVFSDDNRDKDGNAPNEESSLFGAEEGGEASLKSGDEESGKKHKFKNKHNKKDKAKAKDGNRKKLFTPVFTVVFIVLILLFGAIGYNCAYIYNFLYGSNDEDVQGTGTPITETASGNIAKGQMTILILGSDRRWTEASRSDTMMVAFADFDKMQIRLLSIPRDSYVDIPGYGKNKINAAYAFGGVELAEETLNSNFGITCDHFVDLNFQGFRDVIDALGGVTVNVPKDMNYTNIPEYSHEDIHLKKGVQTLNGDQALQFCRFRHDAQGDWGRIERQQAFLVALKDQVYAPGTLLKIPALCQAVSNNMHTDLTGSQILQLCLALKDGFDLETYEPDNTADYIEEISYVFISQGGKDLITSLANFDEVVTGLQKDTNLDVTPEGTYSNTESAEDTGSADGTYEEGNSGE